MHGAAAVCREGSSGVEREETVVYFGWRRLPPFFTRCDETLRDMQYQLLGDTIDCYPIVIEDVCQ